MFVPVEAKIESGGIEGETDKTTHADAVKIDRGHHLERCKRCEDQSHILERVSRPLRLG